MAVGGAPFPQGFGGHGTALYSAVNAQYGHAEATHGHQTGTLTFRVEPGLRETLRTAATREHRSLAKKQG